MINVVLTNLPYLLRGALVTLWLALAVITVGTLLGTGLGILATGGSRVVRGLITVYIFVLRGIPVLVVMFFGYYAFPAMGLRGDAYVAVGVGPVVYVGAF